MTDDYRVWTKVAHNNSFALIILAGATLAAPALEMRPHLIDLNRTYAAKDYDFLDAAIGDAAAVALGESIHVTREMQRVRLNFLRYLHEERNFNLLAVEGSTIDGWTA